MERIKDISTLVYRLNKFPSIPIPLHACAS